MSKYRRRRVKLKAHGRGDNRHERGVALMDKKARLSQEIARMKNGKRGASWQVRTSDGSESAVTSRDAGLCTPVIERIPAALVAPLLASCSNEQRT